MTKLHLLAIWLLGLSAFVLYSSMDLKNAGTIQTTVERTPDSAAISNIDAISRDTLSDVIAETSSAVLDVITRGTELDQTIREGQGSAFFISADGKAVTSLHVIEGSNSISLRLMNGQEYEAKVLGVDEETDLAVLQIDSDVSVPYLSFYKGSELRVGEQVIAIGNPFGIGQSVSTGIISAIGRDRVDSGTYVDYMQTDAALNRGNNGGPMLNMTGEVVGLNSTIYSPVGGYVGIGFIIPYNIVEKIALDIIENGKPIRGFIGVDLRDAEFTYDGDREPFQSGASVESIEPNSPADRAGLRVDDIILKINDIPMNSATDVVRAVSKMSPDQTISIVIQRDEIKYSLISDITERPPKAEIDSLQGNIPPVGVSQTSAPASLDTSLRLLEISASFREFIGMRPNQTGVYVSAVLPDSSAARKGLKAGMVITAVDNKDVLSLTAYENMIATAKRNKKTSVGLKIRISSGAETYVTLPL